MTKMTKQELIDAILENRDAANGVAGFTYQDAQHALGMIWDGDYPPVELLKEIRDEHYQELLAVLNGGA
jgi:hypothetical protein